MKSIHLATDQTCTGCMACADCCPTKALTPIVKADGHRYVSYNNDLCILCHKCERVCPVVNKTPYGNLSLTTSVPYAALSRDKRLREKAGSGGIFAAVATYILAKGGVVCGAELQTDHVKHIFIESPDEISRLQGTKYMQSDTTGIYSQVKTYLDNNRIVLFSGVGCQVAGLLSFLGKHPHIDRLYTIDLICGGVPSSLLVKKFMADSPLQPRGINRFREGAKYVFSYIDRRNSVVTMPPQERALPLYGYTSGLTNRFCCSNCQFTGSHRLSSATIGDFWNDFSKDVHRSVMICHNNQGLELLENADIDKEPISWEQFLPYNSRLVYGKAPYNHRPERKYLAWIFNRFSYRTIEKIYATHIKPYDIAWMCYKIERHLFQKLALRTAQRYACRLLNQAEKNSDISS